MAKESEDTLEVMNYETEQSFSFYDNTDVNSYPKHRHDAVEIVMPICNVYRMEAEHHQYNLNEYDILIIPSRCSHTIFAPESNGRRIILLFSLALLSTIRVLGSMTFLYKKPYLLTSETDPDVHEVIKNALLKMLDEDLYRRPYYDIAIVNEIINITLQLGRKNHKEIYSNTRTQYADRIDVCINFIDWNCSKKLTLSMAAKATGFSKHYFSRWFLKCTNMYFYDYLTKIRVKKAENLLLRSNLPVTVIAHESGYQSISSFNRAFKQQNNCTPKEFRRIRQKNVQHTDTYADDNVIDTAVFTMKTPMPGDVFSIIGASFLTRANCEGMFTNPFIWSDIPDPDVVRVGDCYYMTSTTMYFCPGVPLMKSYDLVHWRIVNYAYDILDDSDACALRNGATAYGKGSWASSLRYKNGTYYVSVASFTTNKTYIFQTEDIESGSWRRYVIDKMYHDSSLLFDDDGRVYLVYGGGTIRIVELTTDATALLPGSTDDIIIDKADAGGNGGLPAEGAHIHKIDGRYYLFLIAWPPTGSGRRIELCYRSDHIKGPYEGRIVLDDDLEYKNMGVAQGGIIDTPNGDWYAMLFQDHGAVGRIPVLVPVKWTDGWPVFGVDGCVPQVMRLPAARSIEENVIISDEFYQVKPMTKSIKTMQGENNAVESKLLLSWQFNHNPDHNLWSLTERPSHFRLKSAYLCNGLMDARNTLTQRTFGPTSAGTAALDTGGMNDGDFAGLAALQDMFGYVGVKMVNGQKYIVMVNAASGSPIEVRSILLRQERLYLRVDFNFDISDSARFYYSLDELRWCAIGDTLPMQYKLTHFTGYRFALFYYSTQVVGGHADFDYFRISAEPAINNETLSILRAYLEGDTTLEGAKNTQTAVAIHMEALPKGDYKGIYLSFPIPEIFDVLDVEFEQDNISGKPEYNVVDGRLLINVTSDKINYVCHKSDRFALLRFRLNDHVAQNLQVNLQPDYIYVDGGNVSYLTHETLIKINIRASVNR